MKGFLPRVGVSLIKMGNYLVKSPQEEREEWTKRSEQLDERLKRVDEATRLLEDCLNSATKIATDARNKLIKEWQEYEDIPKEWIDTVTCCTETIESLCQTIINGDIGTLKREQNSFLRSQKNSLSSIMKNLKLLNQQIKEQRITPRNQYEQQLEKLDSKHKPIRQTVQKLEDLIKDARDAILVAKANNISWEFKQTYKKIQSRIIGLWYIIVALMLVALIWLIFIISIMPPSIDTLSLISYFTIRLSVLIVLAIPYTLLRRTIISSEDEAKLYKYKETLITTFIAFRERIAEDDKEVRESITRGMLQAIVTPPQGISLPTLSDFLKGTKSLQDDEADASEDTS